MQSIQNNVNYFLNFIYNFPESCTAYEPCPRSLWNIFSETKQCAVTKFGSQCSKELNHPLLAAAAVITGIALTILYLGKKTKTTTGSPCETYKATKITYYRKNTGVDSEKTPWVKCESESDKKLASYRIIRTDRYELLQYGQLQDSDFIRGSFDDKGAFTPTDAKTCSAFNLCESAFLKLSLDKATQAAKTSGWSDTQIWNYKRYPLFFLSNPQCLESKVSPIYGYWPRAISSKINRL